jgi:hypothetical protein
VIKAASAAFFISLVDNLYFVPILNKTPTMKSILIIVCALCLAGNINAQEKTNTPKAKYKSGSSIVTVWENEVEGKYGPFTKLNFQVERVYKRMKNGLAPTTLH